LLKRVPIAATSGCGCPKRGSRPLTCFAAVGDGAP
jgi:hypothetical protein